MSILDDQSSMPAFVQSGINALIKLSSRKHKELRTAGEAILATLKKEEDEARAKANSSEGVVTTVDTDADKYFLPFKLACDTGQSKLMATSLDYIQKLIAYGYLDGATIADPLVYPPKPKANNTNNNNNPSTLGNNPNPSPSGPLSTPLSASPSPSPSTNNNNTGAPAVPSSPNPNNNTNNNNNPAGRRLISVIIECLYECSQSRDSAVQIPVIRAILTCVTSVSCQVHEQALLQAVTACYQVYLQATDDVNRTTAKATLIQIFNLVFQRMEHTALQLLKIEQTTKMQLSAMNNNPSSNNNTNTNNPTSTSASESAAEKSSNNVSAEDQKENVGSSVLAPAESGIDVDDMRANIQKLYESESNANPSNSLSPEDASTVSSGNSESSISLPSPSPPNPSNPDTPQAPSNVTAPTDSPQAQATNPAPVRGKFGFCVVCGKSAAHYCLHTKDAVCCMECKLVNLNRKDPNHEIAASMKNRTLAKFSILQNDAWHLLRALCRLASKPLPSPIENAALESKLLSLQLLLSVLGNAGPIFRSSPHFISLVKTELVTCLLKNSATHSENIFGLSSSIFVSLIAHFKPHLLGVIGPFLDTIYLAHILSPHSTYEHKHVSLKVINKLCSEPQTIVDIFLNYDCEIGSFQTFQKIATALEKLSFGTFGLSETWLTDIEKANLKLLALESLVATMTSLVAWTRRLPPVNNSSINTNNLNNNNVLVSQRDRPSRAMSSGEENDNDNESDALTTNEPTNDGEVSDKESSTSNVNSNNNISSTHVGTGSANSRDSLVPSASSWSTQFEQQRATKRQWEAGVLKFNMKPKNGLLYLQKAGLLDNTPEAIASFFLHTPGLDKVVVGEYMGGEQDFNKKVMYAYVEQLDFHGLHFDDGIRHFLAGFRLPGEAQKIDRMMEKFAELYVKHNPGLFSTADAAYVLAYSLIMLNVDAHSPYIKNRMTKEDFLKNNRGIDDGKDLSQAFLGELFDRIHANEIKMKDDEIIAKATANAALPAKKRITMFQRESQAMVKKTQELIKKQPNEEASPVTPTTSNNNPNPVNSFNSANDNKPFYIATDGDVEAVKLMFDILWYPSLATFSVQLEETDNERIIDLCLDGYKAAIRISSAFNIETSRLAFVTSLKKFTLLGSTREMKPKNIQAIAVLLTICVTEGNYLKESWNEVLQCISEVERLHLIAAGTRPNIDVFNGQRERNNPNGLRDQREQIPNQRDSINSQQILQIEPSMIDRIFTQSAHLDSDAIVDFVNALRHVSEQELTSKESPRVFSLQKIVEITYYNMGRIRLVWSKIWSILSEYFTKAGCHPNLNISMYAIDSLRQLAMKFLEKDELSSFQFQKQFFRPFEFIMLNTTSSEVRELIIQCLSRMIMARVNNIKSGWKGVFVVLTAAAKHDSHNLVTSAYELINTLMTSHFNIFAESDLAVIDDTVNCLVAFGGNPWFTDISLSSIEYLLTCANFLGQQENFNTHNFDSELLKEPATVRQSSANDTNNNPANKEANRLRAWFLVLTGLSSMVADPRLEVRSRALQTLFKILHQNGHLFTAPTWRTIFHGVLFPIFDDIRHTRDTVRTRQRQNFDTNNNTLASTPSTPSHSQLVNNNAIAQSPNPSPAAAVSRRLHSNSNPSVPPSPTTSTSTNVSISNLGNNRAPRPSSGIGSTGIPPAPVLPPPPVSLIDIQWLTTTCYNAMSTLIELFNRFHSTVHFLLPEILDLINSCIDQESEDLARIGVKCLTELLHTTGSLFSNQEWWIVTEYLSTIVQQTLPHSLLSYRTRSLIGLGQTINSNPSNLTPALSLPPRPSASSPNTSNNAPIPSPSDADNTLTTSNNVDMDSSQNLSSQANAPPSNVNASPTPVQANVAPLASPHPNPNTVSPSPIAPSGSNPPSIGINNNSTVGVYVLPFHPSVIFTKCRVSLLLVEAISDLINKYFPSVNDSPYTGSLSNEKLQALTYVAPVPSLLPFITNNSTFQLVDFSLDNVSENSISQPTEFNSSSSEKEQEAQGSDKTSDGPISEPFKSVVLGFLTIPQIDRLLTILLISLSFARSFNLDITLRRRLYASGLIQSESPSRLPQLFTQESRSIHVIVKVLSNITVQYYNPTFFKQLAGDEKGTSLGPGIGEFTLSVRSCSNRLMGLYLRIMTEYSTKVLAGQMVALESMDVVICDLFESLKLLPKPLFNENIKTVFPSIASLISHGSPQIRAKIAQFMSSHISQFLP